MRRPRLRAVIAPALRVAAALLLFASLFSVWRLPELENGGFYIVWYEFAWAFHPDYLLNLGLEDDGFQDGWERWRLLDAALVALSLGLVGTTVVRRRALAALLTLGASATGTCIALSGFDSISPGPYLALAALALAILALTPLLRRPRAPTL